MGSVDEQLEKLVRYHAQHRMGNPSRNKYRFRQMKTLLIRCENFQRLLQSLTLVVIVCGDGDPGRCKNPEG